jgi:hypothetical protein
MIRCKFSTDVAESVVGRTEWIDRSDIHAIRTWKTGQALSMLPISMDRHKQLNDIGPSQSRHFTLGDTKCGMTKASTAHLQSRRQNKR